MKHVGNGPELMADLVASSPGEDTSRFFLLADKHEQNVVLPEVC